MSLNPLIIRELKHDAPFAWHLRNLAANSPIFRSVHLAELDQRLDAYLACFQSGEQEQLFLTTKLNPEDWGTIFILSIVAIYKTNLSIFNHAIAVLKEEQQVKELSDALCRVDLDIVQPFIDTLLVHENSLARIAAITATGFFNKDIDHKLLRRYLNDTKTVIVATLKIIGQNKIHTCDDTVLKFLTHDNELLRFQAAYTGCLLDLKTAIPVLKHFCFEETPYLRTAIGLVYYVVNASDISDAFARIQKSDFSPRIKAHNIAMAGLPDNIAILLEWMKDPEYAPIAGEAFSFITGVDIEEDDLSIIDVELCESQEAPLAQKRKKDRWTEGYEDDLPWPDPDLVSMWWRANRHNFQNGTRYLAGKTLTEENLQEILKEGTQTQRITASLILATQNPDVTVKDVTGYQQ